MDWLTSNLWPIVAALLPTIGLAFMFYVIMKHILEADRRERAAQRAWEASLAEHDRGTGGEVAPGTISPPSDEPQHQAGEAGDKG